MVNIYIKDLVPSASSYADGEVIFKLISKKVAAGEDVIVSFKEIPATPSAFINSAFVRLLVVTSIHNILQHLKIVDSTRFINDLIKSRLLFASTRH